MENLVIADILEQRFDVTFPVLSTRYKVFFISFSFSSFFLSVINVRVNQEGRHLASAGAEEPGNELRLKKLSNGPQIKRENKAEAEPSASAALYSTCQIN